jgi:hypothetical protein
VSSQLERDVSNRALFRRALAGHDATAGEGDSDERAFPVGAAGEIGPPQMVLEALALGVAQS